ncbi:MAG: hypothetical protein UZ05_CHB002002200 [Chlorobi bacterium OLB5]|nr:MAG: hypothetical protein UZ05_CHB002002200 [Chlorobi bacterium OLB5]
MLINKLKAGKIIVIKAPAMIYADYVKAVTLSGNCYVENSIGTIKPHQIIDVLDSLEEYRQNDKAGKYRL